MKLTRGIELKMGSTRLGRVVCGVAPQTSSDKFLTLNGEFRMVERSQRRDAVGSARDASAPQIQLHPSGFGGASSRRQKAFGRRAALTLLEMMVAVTLLAVIMVGLLMMFNQTQKALHIVSQQSDVFEATRATIQMISRDLNEVSDFNQPGVKNCYSTNFATPLSGGAITLPSGTNQQLYFGEAFWLTRANDEWTGIGYFVAGGLNSGIGTLHRFSGSGRGSSALELSTITCLPALSIGRQIWSSTAVASASSSSAPRRCMAA
jgi:type II secretory pathway pseudopilin PulG